MEAERTQSLYDAAVSRFTRTDPSVRAIAIVVASGVLVIAQVVLLLERGTRIEHWQGIAQMSDFEST